MEEGCREGVCAESCGLNSVGESAKEGLAGLFFFL